MEKLPDETHYVGLDLVIRSPEKKLGHSARTDTVVVAKVLPQDSHGLDCRWIAEQRLQPHSDIVDARSIVAHDVVQIVGVLVLAAETKGERLEHHIRAGSTDRNRPDRSFSENRLACNFDPLSILEGEMQSRGNDCREFRLDIAQGTSAVIGKARRDQEIDRDSFPSVNSPALAGGMTLSTDVLLEPGTPQPLRQGSIAAFFEESDSEAHVEVHRPDMGIHTVQQGLLLHQQ